MIFVKRSFLTFYLVLFLWFVPSMLIAQETFQLLTHASELQEGDEIVIANAELSLAMSVQQNTNNRDATSVDIQDNLLFPSSSTQIIQLEGEPGKWLLHVGEGYLYAASSSSNSLRTDVEKVPNDNDRCTLAVGEGNIAIITFTGVNSHNSLRFNPNNGKPIFSCYSSKSSVKDNQQVYWRRGSRKPDAGLITTLSAFQNLEDGTTCKLFLPDMPQVRVVNLKNDTVMLSDDTGLVKFVGVMTNPVMKVDDHVAGYISGEKQSENGISLFVPTTKTNSNLLIIAAPITELPTDIRKMINEERITPSDDRIYTLSGKFTGQEIDSLPKGIYVRAGKKLIIK